MTGLQDLWDIFDTDKHGFNRRETSFRVVQIKSESSKQASFVLFRICPEGFNSPAADWKNKWQGQNPAMSDSLLAISG